MFYFNNFGFICKFNGLYKDLAGKRVEWFTELLETIDYNNI